MEIINNIEDTRVNFENSKLLKSAGFAWRSYKFIDGKIENITGVPIDEHNGFPCYNDEGKLITPRKYTATNQHFPRPSLFQAIEWIRVNFKTDIECRGVRYAGDEETSYYQLYINGCVEGNNKRYKLPVDVYNAGISHTLTNLIF